ncbi:hypothetical protein [Nannocystis punicea]|uniref:MYXO-CTERM domain-containing protein n=1 Tax=Nannocystis punicea TaxID=2995304 RepID=A0ABY7GTQ3_9BACT|nr:hypothetical protein [Nannocystis poenicansa]WAS90337.1 hypothetical protein O0S08_29460 [Nannocystis poenicansa]
MRLQDRYLGTGLVIAALALTPGRADACSTSSPEQGLAVWELMNPPDRLDTAPGGVVALSASVWDMELAEAAARASVTLERDGATSSTTIELVPLATEMFRGLPLWTVVVVARPAEPLVAGEYQVTLAVDRVDFGLEERTFPLNVTAEPLAPLQAPTAAVFEATEVRGELRDSVCCERGPDSCGGMSICRPTEIEQLPALSIRPASLPDAARGNSVLWVQRLDADGQADPSGLFRNLGRHDFTWSVPFAAAQAEYCVILGATNLVDGTSVSSAPRCLSREQVGEPHVVAEELTPEEVELWGCLTPPVHEDGTPFGEAAQVEEEKGCRLGGAGGAWGLLGLVVGLRLRARRRRR